MNQDFAGEQQSLDESDRRQLSAQVYASVENALAVISDMHAGDSHIYYGGFARILGIYPSSYGERIGSIWEEDILKRIHPDDLYGKYLHELRFFHFIKHLPRNKRGDYYLAEKLRMKDSQDNYIPVLHRMFYIAAPSGGSIRYALCLYSPLLYEVPSGSIVNSITGQMTRLEKSNDLQILSEREKQVLRLINQGMMSKHIADSLSISINTVSRHRQGILQKLKVRNSIEACRIAKDLGII